MSLIEPSNRTADLSALKGVEGLTRVDLRHTQVSDLSALSGMKSRLQRGRKQLKQMLDDCCLIELDGRGGVIDYRTRSTECDGCTPKGSCAAGKS